MCAAGEDEENDIDNPRRWVALAVVQTYNPRRKVPRSSVSISELEQCLSKASFSASQSSGMLVLLSYRRSYFDLFTYEWVALGCVLSKPVI